MSTVPKGSPQFKRGRINVVRFSIYATYDEDTKTGTLANITGRKYRMKVYDPATGTLHCEAVAEVTCVLDGDNVTQADIVFEFPAADTEEADWKTAAHAIDQWLPGASGPYPFRGGQVAMEAWSIDGEMGIPT